MESDFLEACKNGNLDIVKHLVASGTDIHECNNYAIGWASANGHLEIVKYLVSIGVNIHTCNEYALRLASSNGYLKVVKYLIYVGADIDKIDNLVYEDIYDLIKMKVKYFGKYENIYKECKMYHEQLIKKLLYGLNNDLVRILINY